MPSEPRCPRCGQPYATKGPRRRLEADEVSLGTLYRHTHGGHVYLHEIEWYDESGGRPSPGLTATLEVEG